MEHSLKKTNSFYEFVIGDLLSDISGISSRNMFGGWGIYKKGVIFGLIINGALYFKVGESNRPDFEKFGSKPFSYKVKTRKKPIELSYWEVPEEVMEDRDMLEKWIEEAVKASVKSKSISKYGKK